MINCCPSKFIRFYQKFLSPALGINCRFWPSCSSYAVLVIEKYGARKGIFMSLKRILKCSQWHPGGIDLP